MMGFRSHLKNSQFMSYRGTINTRHTIKHSCSFFKYYLRLNQIKLEVYIDIMTKKSMCPVEREKHELFHWVFMDILCTSGVMMCYH